MLRRLAALAAGSPRHARRLTSTAPVELVRRHLPGPDGAAEPPLVLVHGMFGMGDCSRARTHDLQIVRVRSDVRAHCGQATTL
eukprot:3982196-Prymnesium_polylepis.1